MSQINLTEAERKSRGSVVRWHLAAQPLVGLIRAGAPLVGGGVRENVAENPRQPGPVDPGSAGRRIRRVPPGNAVRSGDGATPRFGSVLRSPGWLAG